MKAIPTILLALSLVLAPACGKKKGEPEEAKTPPVDETEEPTETVETEEPEEQEPEVQELVATAELQSAPDKDASGTVTFTEKDGQVEIQADIEGLQPGKHGFHVHEKGDCSAEDFKSAGGHFNPEGTEHGGPEAEEHHAGDLGNIEAGEDGTVSTTMTVDFLTVSEGDHAVVGKAVVVHSGEDDLKSQPSGDAGSRVACGVVELKE